MKQLIIFVNGNFMPVALDEKALVVVIADIQNAMNTGNRLSLKFDGGLDGCLLRGDKIDGFYVREPFDNVPQKMLNILEKQTSEGEDWRNRG